MAQCGAKVRMASGDSAQHRRWLIGLVLCSVLIGTGCSDGNGAAEAEPGAAAVGQPVKRVARQESMVATPGSLTPAELMSRLEGPDAPVILHPDQDVPLGDVIDVYPYAGKACRHGSDEVLSEFELKTDILLDEVRGEKLEARREDLAGPAGSIDAQVPIQEPVREQ